ncbi:MFS transporter [Lysinibacillus fusiformis]|uniref:MFS transporter n=1 Tax=unclassified Lysinibacillus TaxID=2636778 RepID=UPI0031594B22
MKRYSKSFRALWIGEIVSELGSAAGGIINGLLLFELTGSKEWLGVFWLVYFIPSLVLQGVAAPFLNHVSKGKAIQNIQLIRSLAYLFPVIGFVLYKNEGIIFGLIILQCILGLLQPIYASLSFSLLPEICEEKELTEANGLLDGTIRLMSFLAPGLTSFLLLVSPIPFIYVFSCCMFLVSYLSLTGISQVSIDRVPVWSKKFWWKEMKEGYHSFFNYPHLLRLTLLSTTVQFAVGATTVLSVPFIRESLNGQSWEYAIFAGSFPIGYFIGILLLAKIPKTDQTMYLGLIGGGLSFVCLYFVESIPIAWLCELFGGIMFPLFNARSAAIFQKIAPKDRMAQLSAVRLLFLRVAMPLGIAFASASFLDLSIGQIYIIVGLIIVLPGLFYFLVQLLRNRTNSI